MRIAKQKRMKIAFFGHFDTANFGNDSTLQAILYHLHCHHPDAEVTCIGTGPEAVVASHQVQAIPISENLFIQSWLPQNPLLRLLRKAFIGLPSEPIRWIKSLMRLRRTDILIIPGTGLLSDASGLTGWGPYNLFKWSLIAKLCRCKLFFVSVGAGPIYSSVGKWLITSALSWADFRSYRDGSTAQYLEGVGFNARRDPVYPDLVFSLPVAVIPHQRTEGRQRSIVGLGLMAYAERDSTPRPTNTIYPAYLRNLASLVKWLLAQQHDIRLLIGDLADVRTKREFTGLLREKSLFDEERVIDEPTCSANDLFSQIAATDIVVATRFHNVVLALLCEKPVVSISFHHKCESLMSAMGLSAYCLDINGLKADELINRVCDLKENAAMLRSQIRQKNHEFRSELDKQYRFIFSDMWRRPNVPNRDIAFPHRTAPQKHTAMLRLGACRWQ